jgi:hypothetical protein
MIKQTFFNFVLVFFSQLLFLSSVNAVVLSINPVSQTVIQGNTASVDLVVSGLESGGLDEIIAAYNIATSFDSAILSFDNAVFGGVLGFTFPSTDVNASNDVVAIETAFSTDDTLAVLQPDSILLVTLNFNTIGTGVSQLDFTSNELTGRNSTLLSHTTTSGSITVSSIPIPSALLLFGTGVLGILGIKKRNL